MLRRVALLLFIITLIVSLFYLGNDVRDLYSVKLKYIRIENDAKDERRKPLTLKGCGR